MTEDLTTIIGGWGHQSQTARACHCVGPQDGKPLCPCQMRGVQVINGRYVQIIDHGPVRPEPTFATSKGSAA